MRKIKTYKNWDKDLNEYLQAGDLVDEEMRNYFETVLPPKTSTGRLIQIGESYSYVEGGATYSTLENISGQWVYRGNCHVGCTIERK